MYQQNKNMSQIVKQIPFFFSSAVVRIEVRQSMLEKAMIFFIQVKKDLYPKSTNRSNFCESLPMY